MEIVLNCSRFTDRDTAHAYLKEQFGFPEYYGNNLDALYDCLMELSNCEILLQNSDSLGEYGLLLLDTLRDASNENPTLKLVVLDP